MLVYPPESRINQHQYERLLEYFDTGDQDISHTINNYLATEHETAHSPDCTVADRAEPGRAESAGWAQEFLREVADEYALAGEVFNGDTRPWEPSNEPPPF